MATAVVDRKRKVFATWLCVWITLLLVVPGAWWQSRLVQQIVIEVLGKVLAMKAALLTYALYVDLPARLFGKAFFERGDFGLFYSRDWMGYCLVGAFYLAVSVSLAAVCTRAQIGGSAR